MTERDGSAEGSPPEGSPSAWYHLEGGEPAGPVGYASIAERVLDGTLGPEDLVWSTGDDAWRPVEQVSELRPLLRGDEEGIGPAADASPPPPPESPPPPPPSGEEAFEMALEEADAEFFGGEPLAGGTDGSGGEPPDGKPSGQEAPGGDVPDGTASDGKGSPDAPVAVVIAWIEDHVLWSAAVGAALAWAVVALALAAGGEDDGADGQASQASAPAPAAVSTDEAVRRHAAALTDSLEDLETADPRRDSLLDRPEDGALLLRIGFQGLRRLPDSEVLGYARAWSTVLTSVDRATCERLAGWRSSSDEVWRSLSSLGDRGRSTLLDRLRRAAVAEIRGEPARREPPGQQEVEAAFARLFERLPPATADTARVLLAGQGPACRLDRLLFAGVSDLDPPHDRRLARALVTPSR